MKPICWNPSQRQFPVIVICDLLGVPGDMARQLLSWSHDMVAMYQARRDRAVEDAAVRATIAFSDFMRATSPSVASRRATICCPN